MIQQVNPVSKNSGIPNRVHLIESATPCHDAQVVESYQYRTTPPDCSDYKVRGLYHCHNTVKIEEIAERLNYLFLLLFKAFLRSGSIGKFNFTHGLQMPEIGHEIS